MLATYKYACEDNDFAMCDEKAGAKAPAPEPKPVVQKKISSRTQVDDAFVEW